MALVRQKITPNKNRNNKSTPSDPEETNALYLAGYKDKEIQKIDQWKSYTFKEYISDQLHSFYKGRSMDMKRQLSFDCVKGSMALVRQKITTNKNRNNKSTPSDPEGPNALYLAGYKDKEIQKIDRWKSYTFKEYISDQLHSFYKGRSMDMKLQLSFVCVKGGLLRIDVSSDVVIWTVTWLLQRVNVRS